MIKSRGEIYFSIATENIEFDLSHFEAYLSIKPTKFQKIFERGQLPKSTKWQYSSGALINPYCLEEIEKLVARLKPHKEEFKQLKLANPDLCFVLQIVIYLGDESPGLNFSNETIEFLNYVGATIDCDFYNEK